MKTTGNLVCEAFSKDEVVAISDLLVSTADYFKKNAPELNDTDIVVGIVLGAILYSQKNRESYTSLDGNREYVENIYSYNQHLSEILMMIATSLKEQHSQDFCEKYIWRNNDYNWNR